MNVEREVHAFRILAENYEKRYLKIEGHEEA
jgi:hypothetical protein